MSDVRKCTAVLPLHPASIARLFLAHESPFTSLTLLNVFIKKKFGGMLRLVRRNGRLDFRDYLYLDSYPEIPFCFFNNTKVL